MKLKGTVKILEDTGSIKEVVGEEFSYTYNDKYSFELIVHESIQPWTPNVLDISEVTTGCRCCSTNKSVSASTKVDIITAMNNFINDKGIKNVLNQVKKRRNKSLTR